MMLLRARDSNIFKSLACIWLEGNQNEFLTHPKIKIKKTCNVHICN